MNIFLILHADIPIILSYDITVDKCLKLVFALPDVVSIIDQVKEMIMRYGSEISSKVNKNKKQFQRMCIYILLFYLLIFIFEIGCRHSYNK